MKKHTLTLSFLLLCTLASAQSEKGKQLSAELDRILSEQFRPQEPGAVVLIIKNGKVIYSKAFGMANLELDVPMKPDNVFRIASITKQFTAVAILQLMEQGKLSLQDDLTRFIPDYPAQGNKITIEHLLTHTSGIQDFTRMKDNPKRAGLDVTPIEMIDYFKAEPMRFTPGTKWEYSNSNYFLLGYIIEKLSGKTYAEYLQEAIFGPLGMNNSSYASNSRITKNRATGYTRGDTSFENAPQVSMSQPYAAGAIQSTAADLAKWQQAVHSYKLVKKETQDRAFARYKLADGNETAYGYGWRLGSFYESPSIWHGGLINGFAVITLYLPKENVFVAILSNCDCNKPEDLALKAAALVTGIPSSYKAIPLDSHLLKSYTGVYENEHGETRVITNAGNKLYSQRGRTPKIPVQAWETNKFFFEDAFQTMEFGKSKTGEIEGLTIRSRRGNELWTRTSKPIPDESGIKLDESILETYVGSYQVTPEFSFSVTKEHAKLFLQASGQEKLEMSAETDSRFFLKVNGAEIEFVKNPSGQVNSAILKQGGRKTEANKIR